MQIKANKAVSVKQRRDFLKTLALGTSAVTIVPRHVLGGPGLIAPPSAWAGWAAAMWA